VHRSLHQHWPQDPQEALLKSQQFTSIVVSRVTLEASNLIGGH
jgi:hypothetical protein